MIEHREHLAAPLAPRRDLGKRAVHQEIQDRLRITKVVLVSRQRSSPDQPRITYLYLYSVFKEQLFKPPQTTRRLYPDNHLVSKLAIKRLQRLLVRMQKLPIPHLSIPLVTISNRLLVWVKINPDVYCHC